ncbi:MAG: (2Fe-2S)-binding protein [Akkermansiaceae bacterium]|nr:(2Fe-2S)-binding protein [Armatimonadota bacterium]
MIKITELDVNGSRHTIRVDAERSLLSVLRDDLDLTGAKYGCGEAQCGACIVIIDGQPTPSCVTPVGDVRGKRVTTIEGLEQNGRLHPLQEAFLEAGALQCGYCTPGMILSGVALLRDNPDPSEAEIARALEVNVCRCGMHSRIIAAVRRAAQTLKADTSPEESA